MNKKTWNIPALKELDIRMTMTGDDDNYFEATNKKSVTVFAKIGGKIPIKPLDPVES